MRADLATACGDVLFEDDVHYLGGPVYFPLESESRWDRNFFFFFWRTSHQWELLVFLGVESDSQCLLLELSFEWNACTLGYILFDTMVTAAQVSPPLWLGDVHVCAVSSSSWNVAGEQFSWELRINHWMQLDATVRVTMLEVYIYWKSGIMKKLQPPRWGINERFILV